MPLVIAVAVWAFARGSMVLSGWESLAQRVVLIAIAVLVVTGNLVLLLPAHGRGPRLRWFVGWVGCCTAAVQGPVLLVLAKDSSVNPVLLTVAAIATPSAIALGLSAMHRSEQASIVVR